MSSWGGNTRSETTIKMRIGDHWELPLVAGLKSQTKQNPEKTWEKKVKWEGKHASWKHFSNFLVGHGKLLKVMENNVITSWLNLTLFEFEKVQCVPTSTRET